MGIPTEFSKTNSLFFRRLGNLLYIYPYLNRRQNKQNLTLFVTRMSITKRGLRLLLNNRRSFRQTVCLCSSANASAKPPEKEENTGYTHFGYEQVHESEKTQKVYEVFENVAKSYDAMNDAMSLGIHRIWKDIFIHRLGPMNGTTLLDVAGGTGDIAFRFLDYVDQERLSDCHVTVTDINAAMIRVGQKKSQKLGHDQSKISWKQGNAEELPFESDTFNAYTIAFGIRNCTHIDKVIQEAYRVLKPGGRLMCLEFSHLPDPNMQWLYDQYSFQVIPVMGQLISGQWKPYQYLVESIRKFPNQESFKELIEQSGFRQVTYENLTLGIAAIHSGFKL